MCGIAGSLNFHLDIDLLSQCLQHRGPNEQATFRKANLELHHARLAILDIAGGKQPMQYGQYTIIFNGEIYNHLDVRTRLGLDCTTGSDTETILHAYAKAGADCLNYFDGMFAFAIYDEKQGKLFIARDRAGKKPFYYYKTGNQFVFASELNAIRDQVDLQKNDEHLGQFVRLGYFFRSSTPYLNVWELPAGSYGTVSMETAEIKITQWWNIHPFYESRKTDDFETALSKVDGFLHRGVKQRVESSDLEVGSFLSGGIDSGLVTAIASEYNNKLKTFTVSFEGEYDEAPLARLVADRYQTDHHEIRISFNDLLNDIEKILANYGEPYFDDSAIPSYYVSREAKKSLTVILNGDGGDELFGGYRRYVPFSRFDFFKASKFTRGIAGAMHAIMPVSHNRKSKYNYLYRLTDLVRKDNTAIYLSSTIDAFDGYEQHLKGSDGLDGLRSQFNMINQSSLTGLQKIMNLDFDNILSGNLLVKMDIATMASSLEGRSPFLAKDLLEYVPGLPDNFKIRGVTTKYLLRKLAARYLPDILLNQPKRGFEIPLKGWVNHQLKDMINDYLRSSDRLYPDLVDQQFVYDLLDDKLNVPAEKRAKMIWLVFTLEVWYHKVYKKDQH